MEAGLCAVEGKQSLGSGNRMRAESLWASRGTQYTPETSGAALCKSQGLSGGCGVAEFRGKLGRTQGRNS